MTKADWLEIAVEIQARWPQKEIPDESWEIWFTDLQHLPAEHVQTAIRALYLDGREWCPNGGQILAKVQELDSVTVDHGQAWRLAKRATLKADPLEAERWLTEQSPEAMEAVRRISGPQLSYLLDDESTVRAQFRDIFNSIVRAKDRDARYAGLPTVVGLRSLEGPRKIGAAMRRALPEGSA